MLIVNLFPFFLSVQKYPLKRALNQLHLIQQKYSHEYNDWNDEIRWNMFDFHYKNNLLYREIVNKQSDKRPKYWYEIPIVTKYWLQRPLAEIVSSGVKHSDLYISSTSGSSGHPFFFAKDKFCHAITWALILERYSVHGIKYGDSLQARFYGLPLEKKSRIVEKAKDLISSRIRFPVFNLSDTVLLSFLKEFEKRQIEYINGYTSALTCFARFLENRRICLRDICPTLKIAIPTAEVLTESDRKLIQNNFGVPVINEYGASEVGIIAIENESFKWKLSNEILFIEIVDDFDNPLPHGKSGRILITSLFNRAMPFIRYEIGDIGSITYDNADGKGILLSLEGRTNDFALLPSGKKVPGLTFYYISKSLLESGYNLREFIIKQVQPDTFVFEYVADNELSVYERKQVSEAMDLYLESGLRVEFERKLKIDRTASGKLKHFQYLVGKI